MAKYKRTTSVLKRRAPAPPIITVQPVAAVIAETEQGELSVTATGTDLKYQWYKNGMPIFGTPVDTSVTGSQGDTLAFTNFSSNDSGAYYVIVSNEGGSVNSDLAEVSMA
jgi:hypothetical protein